MIRQSLISCFFFFNDTATTEIYTLSLHDALPICERGRYMSYMMVVMMLATIGGPLLGGFITTSFSWRWIFYIDRKSTRLNSSHSQISYAVFCLKKKKKKKVKNPEPNSTPDHSSHT